MTEPGTLGRRMGEYVGQQPRRGRSSSYKVPDDERRAIVLRNVRLLHERGDDPRAFLKVDDETLLEAGVPLPCPVCGAPRRMGRHGVLKTCGDRSCWNTLANRGRKRTRRSRETRAKIGAGMRRSWRERRRSLDRSAAEDPEAGGSPSRREPARV